MTKEEYRQQRLDPRWQKKRLEIMQRDGFCCSVCICDDKPLAVHHLYYVTGRKPWEYPDFSLQTLCDDCHAEKHAPQEDEPPCVYAEWEQQVNWIFGGNVLNAPLHWSLAVAIQEAGMKEIKRPWLFEHLAECTKAYVMRENALRP